MRQLVGIVLSLLFTTSFCQPTPMETETERLGKFIFDGNNNGGAFGNLFNLNLDSNAVYEGVFKPENIAIHVSQNAFNFFSSTLGWIIAGAIYSSTQSQGRSLYTGSGFSGLGSFSPSASLGAVRRQDELEDQLQVFDEEGELVEDEENQHYFSSPSYSPRRLEALEQPETKLIKRRRRRRKNNQ